MLARLPELADMDVLVTLITFRTGHRKSEVFVTGTASYGLVKAPQRKIGFPIMVEGHFRQQRCP